MKPHQERVIIERYQLEEKLEKLNAFLLSEKAIELSNVELERLQRQREYMRLYLGVLDERIAAFDCWTRELTPEERDIINRTAKALIAPR